MFPSNRYTNDIIWSVSKERIVMNKSYKVIRWLLDNSNGELTFDDVLKAINEKTLESVLKSYRYNLDDFNEDGTYKGM